MAAKILLLRRCSGAINSAAIGLAVNTPNAAFVTYAAACGTASIV
jgi:hypothetical protein